MRLYLLFTICLLGVFSQRAVAQITDQDIVEVAGVVAYKNSRGVMEKVPFATIAVQGTSRGSYANYDGMFSIVIRKGQTLKFTAVGYAPAEITIPADYPENRYSLALELKPTDVNLNEVVVFPWPDRDNLRAEFLAMQPNQALQMEEIAKDNLRERQLMALKETFKMDSREAATYYLQKQARDFSYMGQRAPTAIFDPLAWAKFAKSLKENKKKKDKENEQNK